MSLLSIFIGGLFLLSGLWRLAVFVLDWQASNVQGRWEVVEGQVTRADLERISPCDEPDSIALYGVNIIYMYTVGDKNYRGEVTDDEVGTLRKTQAEQLLDELANGNRVDVYYNPYQPNLSTLFPAADSRLFRDLGFGLVGLIGGIVILVLGI